MWGMKKWIFVFLIIILILAGFFYWRRATLKSDKVLSAVEAPTPIPSPRIWKQSTVIDVDRIPIRISWAIAQPKDVELYSNLKEQKLSEEIKVNKSCSVLVSGGFYFPDLTHLGLLVSNFEVTSQAMLSATFNGFLSIDSTDKVFISLDHPNNPRLGLQSGPILMLNKKTQILSIKNDETSRRIVAATTADNQLYFLAVYQDGSEYLGPLLGNLPEIIDLFAKRNNIEITDAINLDGGSASVFISNYDRINELAHVGSYFCIK